MPIKLSKMSKKKPLVSVVMPAYNSEKYISEAIESILNQTFKDFEFIIIDDASTDKTWDIIQDYAKRDARIVSLKNDSNLRISFTLNKGVLIARGKYVARMDADDWSYPDRLGKQVEVLEKNPETVICGGSIDVANIDMQHLNYRRYPLTDRKVRFAMFIYNPFAHPCVMYRLDAIKKAGLYNVYYLVAEDYDLYFRLGNIGKFANIPDLLLRLRVHKKSSSQSYLRKQELITILVRFKAYVVYGYPLSFFTFVYTVAQLIGVFVIPSSIKFRLFNFLRSSRRIPG